MAIRVEHSSDMEPGATRLTRPGSGALSGETLEISIARVDLGSPRFLDPRYTDDQAWGAGEKWFAPDEAERSGDTLQMFFGPAIAWNMKPHMPFLVKLRDASGTVIEDRMVWPVIRLPSSAPPPSVSNRVETPETPKTPEPELVDPEGVEEDPLDHFANLAAHQPVEPEVTAPPIPPEPTPTPVPDPPAPKPVRSRMPMIMAVLALLVLVVGGVTYYYMTLPDDQIITAEDPVSDGPELTLAGARGYLKETPPANDAALQAKRFEEAGSADAAFLIRSYAARKGDAASAIVLGDLYSPTSFAEGGVVTSADAARAVEFYLTAAETEEAGLLKAGALLKAGEIDDTALTEQVQAALKKAVDAGNEKAKEFLE